VRVVKRKWDGSVSAVDDASRVEVPGGSPAWVVRSGSRRERRAAGELVVVDRDELWVAVPGEWWVLCAYADASGTLTGYKVHAAAPFEAPPEGEDEDVEWVDLDLDFEVTGDEVALQDEAEFHEHARTMGYPDEVVRGAWSGISTIAARYTNGDWPFDGSMQGMGGRRVAGVTRRRRRDQSKRSGSVRQISSHRGWKDSHPAIGLALISRV
jgi:protein associated with RNAse G/E